MAVLFLTLIFFFLRLRIRGKFGFGVINLYVYCILGHPDLKRSELAGKDPSCPKRDRLVQKRPEMSRQLGYFSQKF